MTGERRSRSLRGGVLGPDVTVTQVPVTKRSGHATTLAARCTRAHQPQAPSRAQVQSKSKSYSKREFESVSMSMRYEHGYG